MSALVPSIRMCPCVGSGRRPSGGGTLREEYTLRLMAQVRRRARGASRSLKLCRQPDLG
jgi:hypothetical protein